MNSIRSVVHHIYQLTICNTSKTPKAYIQPFYRHRTTFTVQLILVLALIIFPPNTHVSPISLLYRHTLLGTLSIIIFSFIIRELYTQFWNHHLTTKSQLLNTINQIELLEHQQQEHHTEQLELVRNEFIRHKCTLHFKRALQIVFCALLCSILPFGFQMKLFLQLLSQIPYQSFSQLPTLLIHLSLHLAILSDLVIRLRIFCTCSVELAEYHIIPLSAPSIAA